MKAEQRKELETNTLADKMGHVMQRVQSSPRRTFAIYALITAVVLIAAFLGWRWWAGEREARSMNWIRFYDGSGSQIENLANAPESKDTFAGKAARFQMAWDYYWDQGIKMAATDQRGSMARLRAVATYYGELAKECKDDPIFEPQALLGQAVATESLAAQNPDNLKEAKELYKSLAEHEKYGKTAEAKFAQDRLKVMDDDAKFRALAETYQDLRLLLSIPAEEKRVFGAPGGKVK